MFSEFKRLVKHSSIYGLANVLGKGIGFLMIPIYTHYILPEDYGLLELLDISINIISMFLGVGLTTAVTRFYMQYKEPEAKKRVISTAILFFSIVMVFLLGLSVIIARPFATYILGSSAYSQYALIALITLSFTLILEIPISYFVAREQSGLFTLISLLRLIISLALNIYFVVVIQIGILGILYSGIITAVLFGVALSIWTLKQVGVHFDYAILKEMVKFGYPLIFNRMGMFVINFGDRFFLKAFAGLQQLGLYALGYKLGFMISFLIGSPFFKIWSVRQYEVIEEEHGEEKIANVFDVYASFLYWLWLLVSVFSSELLHIMADPKYHEAYKIIPLIALGYVFREHADFFKGVFYIEKRTKIIGGITIAVALYCLLNYSLLIPSLGSMGAAIATLSTFMFMALINYMFANRIRKIPYNFRLYFSALGLALGIWGLDMAAMSAIQSLPLLILVKLGSIALFPIIFFNFLSPYEKEIVMKLYDGLLQRLRRQPQKREGT